MELMKRREREEGVKDEKKRLSPASRIYFFLCLIYCLILDYIILRRKRGTKVVNNLVYFSNGRGQIYKSTEVHLIDSS